MTDPVISARGLTKRFGKVVALDGLDLDVPPGAALGLLGPAGSGKSTLVRLLAGLVRPSAGSLTIGGSRAGSLAARRRLGVVLQDARLYGWMTARETIAFGADLAGVPRSEMAGRIDDVAQRLSVTEVLDRRIASLDASTRGWLAVAQVVVGDPAVLVLDEPFHWLASDARRGVLGVLAGLRGKTTIVLATPHRADIDALCDHVAILEAGRLVRTGPVAAGTVADTGRRAAPAYVIETDAAGGLALEGLVARLRSEPWVTEVGVTGGTLRVRVSDEARASRELLSAVVGTGVPVSAFRPDADARDGTGPEPPR